MFILKKGHQPGVYVPLRALFLVYPAHKCSDSKKLKNVKKPTIADILAFMSWINFMLS